MVNMNILATFKYRAPQTSYIIKELHEQNLVNSPISQDSWRSGNTPSFQESAQDFHSTIQLTHSLLYINDLWMIKFSDYQHESLRMHFHIRSFPCLFHFFFFQNCFQCRSCERRRAFYELSDCAVRDEGFEWLQALRTLTNALSLNGSHKPYQQLRMKSQLYIFSPDQWPSNPKPLPFPISLGLLLLLPWLYFGQGCGLWVTEDEVSVSHRALVNVKSCCSNCRWELVKGRASKDVQIPSQSRIKANEDDPHSSKDRSLEDVFQIVYHALWCKSCI